MHEDMELGELITFWR